ncbi:7626_t:CDS:2, partial [Racocetra fulgida]
LDPNNQRNRRSKATECEWKVNANFSKRTSMISFTTVVDKHTHPLVPSPATNIARYRKLGNDMVEFIEFCVHHGVTSAQSIGRLLKGKFPGRKVYQKALYNAIQVAKKKLVTRVEFDAADLMKQLYSRRAEDSRWFVEAKFEKNERRLCGLVWLSPEQQILWTRYHDVLFFDTTSRTNKYNMVACFFVVVDNCNRTRLVATALLEDETENSFSWALQMIKKCMGSLTPKVVFTDSDPAMISAINLEFSDSIHCLCIFHLDLNLKKNLRNKLSSIEFKEFREAFFKCRNILVSSVFESQWESLKVEYPSISGYIKRQLDPFKHKWAICYTNNQFTAGANSTQRVESFNRKIHDCVRSSSSLLELTKEIQDLLDKEAEYVRVEEYKEQIPMIGLPTISKTYFNSIETVVSRSLLPAMVFVVCKQMQECFYYDCFRMDSTVVDLIVEEQVNINNIEGAREDNYDITKICLADIISTVRQEQVIEIWRVVLRCSPQAKWHIGLIAARWYKDNFVDDIWKQSPITICANSDETHVPCDVEYPICKFDHIKQVRKTEVYSQTLREVNNTRQKYGRAQGIMRKVLDIAIATDSYDELMGICHGFILDKQGNQEPDTITDEIECNIKNPVVSTRKGRPPGRAKSNVEVQDQRAKKMRHPQTSEITNEYEIKDNRKTCQNCGNKGHNRATCKINQ